MKIIDLSHFIEEDMPVFPGTSPPALSPAFTIDDHGSAETMLQMLSHTGTHIDAPGHMLAGAAGLDDFPVDKFFGMALIIDYPPCAGNTIALPSLQQMQNKIERAEFVLFHTGQSQKWGVADYFGTFTTLTAEAAQYLASFPLKGVGIDAISFDVVGAKENTIHHILLSAGFILIENLTNLQQVQDEYCLFSAMPLKYRRADGSPVRAFAIELASAI